ncbi:DUF2953 domain-containing protein [Cribrihabitans neustonicus]|uniref:DUF2953 domain-containing protein n=1 Tax=Cribrihabitans neustonicus TaxID=1429085 RepID=UPI003B58CB62
MLSALLIGGLALLIGFFALLLFTPLHLELMVQNETCLAFKAAFRPCGGFGPRLTLSRRGRPDQSAKTRRKRGRRRGGTGARPLRVAAAALWLAAEILRRVHICKLVAEGTFGTGDPAETGQLFGLLAPLIYAPAWSRRLRFEVEPDFSRACFSGRAELVLSVVPVALLGPAARFGWRAFGPVW